MNTVGTNERLKIERKEPMVPFGLRLPRRDAKVLLATARKHKCKGADLLRTAWQEYRITHQLGED